MRANGDNLTTVPVEGSVEHLSDEALIDLISGADGAGARLLAGGDATDVFGLGPRVIAKRAGLSMDDARRVAAAFVAARRIRKQRARTKPEITHIDEALTRLKARARRGSIQGLWLLASDIHHRLTMRHIAGAAEMLDQVDPSLFLRHVVEVGARSFDVVRVQSEGSNERPIITKSDKAAIRKVRLIATRYNVYLLRFIVLGPSGTAEYALPPIEEKEAE